jgi:coenzyme F420-reducing hydrogenase delta subunit
MVNISAAMAKNLVDEIFEMVDTIKQIGPNPLKTNSKILKEEIHK